MKAKVYIDGQEGTTGLQIYDRLSTRNDIELLRIEADKRKDTKTRKELINAADIVFLCLPDAAAIEAVALVENPETRIIDASTAHRTNTNWTYGFPELSNIHREVIQKSKRVANPGCHATGFISVVYPLVAAGVLPKDTLLSCFSLTGYSGGGKKMIAEYEDKKRNTLLSSPSIYGVMQTHKHLPEMRTVCDLNTFPVFSPIVDDYYKGMATTVPFHMAQLKNISTLRDVWEIFKNHYGTYDGKRVVWTEPLVSENSVKFYGAAKAGTDSLSIFVAGNEEQFTVTALFDNLGKGASGAAVQNMNLMLGLDEITGLHID